MSTPSSILSPARRPQASPARLYAANTGLVGRVLSYFPALSADAREDAYSAGLWGLWQASLHFDRARGLAFASFAGECIKNAVRTHLNRRQRQHRIPVVSLETPIGDGERELSEVIADPQAVRPGAALLDQAGFDGLLSGLPGRQQAVLRAVYQEERPLWSVAEEMGVSKQRAGQIHLEALAALRKETGGSLRGSASL